MVFIKESTKDASLDNKKKLGNHGLDKQGLIVQFMEIVLFSSHSMVALAF